MLAKACDNLRMTLDSTHLASSPGLAEETLAAPLRDPDDARKTVVLGVTGCIAAYKACEVVRALVKDGHRVVVVMTEAATRFVGPLTFRTLTGEPVVTSLWDDPDAAPVHHISLAEEADVIALVPCTANVIAKVAGGTADDMLTTTVLASEAPLVVAPAMNTHMWRDELTQANVETLRTRGAIIVEPGTGDLACGDVGEGRLAPAEEILDAIRTELDRCGDLAGVRMLVTAGPTYEPLDAVRFLGNRSSGRTGYAIAEEAARRGARVTLVSGPTALPDPFGASTVRVETAAEMLDAALAAYDDIDVVIATAAVSDFAPVDANAGKIKKGDAPATIELAPTEDILARLAADKGERLLVGFAAETSDVSAYAREKLQRKSLDLVVANDVSLPGLGFGSKRNRVVLIDAHGEWELPEMDKRMLARELLDEVVTRLASR